MRMTAVGANRQVYTHTITDTEMGSVLLEDGKVRFRQISKQDPGIGAGQYFLTFDFDKEEVFKLYETAIQANTNARIDGLKKQVEELKDELRNIS